MTGLKIRALDQQDRDNNGPLRILIEKTRNGIAGLLLNGTVAGTRQVKVVPSGTRAQLSADSDDGALSLDKDVQLVPGDVICAHDDPVEAADQFNADVDWTGKEPLLPGRAYDFLFAGERKMAGTFTGIKYRIIRDREDHLAAVQLERGEHGVCTFELDSEIAFTPFGENRQLGQFRVISRKDGRISGSGKLNFALRRARNIHRQPIDLNRVHRASQKHQSPCVVWFTGLSGSGKSAIANALELRLNDLGKHTYLLDGDNIRHGLCRDLGFTDADRVENIRRIGEVAKLMADAGLIVLTAFISPFSDERRMARKMMNDGEFIEVFVDTPMHICEQRDEKGLYAKARAGLIKNFTGIDSAYEKPQQAEVTIDTLKMSVEEAADKVLAYLQNLGKLKDRQP